MFQFDSTTAQLVVHFMVGTDEVSQWKDARGSSRYVLNGSPYIDLGDLLGAFPRQDQKTRIGEMIRV